MKCDFLIIGAGIMGLGVANALQGKYPSASIVIIEKERSPGLHASGRNSGVLHAGFYYTADSLKARFTKEGNSALKEFCKEHSLKLNECGKVVVAANEEEIATLLELYERGLANGVELTVVDEEELRHIEPNAKTCGKALHSPNTATVDPAQVVDKLKDIVLSRGAKLYCNTAYEHNPAPGSVMSSQGDIDAGIVINCAGLYADRVAKSFGFARNYTIIPFKGVYLKYAMPDRPVKSNIYPVPKLENPFLGVHYTVTADGDIKIGPTAIPAFGRENYLGFEGIELSDLAEILYYESRLFIHDSFHFRSLALEEFRKYDRAYLASLAKKMVHCIDEEGFDSWSRPGIRAQLLDSRTLELVQDFVVEADSRSVHLLNAVSPAFTCSLPFSEWIVENYID